MEDDQSPLGPWRNEPDALRVAYQISMQRLMEADSKMWQVPALSLTAQAFLLTIALGSQSHTSAERLVSAVLGAVVAIASVQLMRRHMFHSRCDLALLKRIEGTGTLPPMVYREALLENEPAKGLAKWRSAEVWVAVMWAFVLVDAFAAIFAIVAW